MWWYREGNKGQGWRRVGVLSKHCSHTCVISGFWMSNWMSNLSSDLIVFNNLLLVNTIVLVHEPWSFHFLLVFKLFPIGYGPTPSKRKDIVLEQEVVKGLRLYCIGKKRENPFWNKVLSLQSEWEFISKRWHTKSLQLFQVSGRCGRDFFKVMKVLKCGRVFFKSLSFKFQVQKCEREFFKFLRFPTLKFEV